MKEIKSDNNYECDPTNNERPCMIFYNGAKWTGTTHAENNDKDYFEVPCKCSLGEPGVGYCSSIIGTKEYAVVLT